MSRVIKCRLLQLLSERAPVSADQHLTRVVCQAINVAIYERCYELINQCVRHNTARQTRHLRLYRYIIDVTCVCDVCYHSVKRRRCTSATTVEWIWQTTISILNRRTYL